MPDPLRNLGLYTTLVMLAQATATTAHAANNALMAITTRFEDKGKAAGFSMASNVGGTGLLGALALWVSEHVSPRAGGLGLAVVVVASAALALRIVEPRRVDAAVARAGSVTRALGRHLWEMLKDLGRTRAQPRRLHGPHHLSRAGRLRGAHEHLRRHGAGLRRVGAHRSGS